MPLIFDGPMTRWSDDPILRYGPNSSSTVSTPGGAVN